MVKTMSPSCIETAAMETNKREEKGKPRAPAASCEIPQRAQFLESRIVERGGGGFHATATHTATHTQTTTTRCIQGQSPACMHAYPPTHTHARTHARTHAHHTHASNAALTAHKEGENKSPSRAIPSIARESPTLPSTTQTPHTHTHDITKESLAHFARPQDKAEAPESRRQDTVSEKWKPSKTTNDSTMSWCNRCHAELLK